MISQVKDQSSKFSLTERHQAKFITLNPKNESMDNLNNIAAKVQVEEDTVRRLVDRLTKEIDQDEIDYHRLI